MIILAIDPGYERLGIAIIEREQKNKEFLLYSECFKTSAKLPHHERLTLIGNKIKEVIKEYKPEILATEKLFFSTNRKTALLVAEARGVILYSASSMGLEIFEYTPASIKIAVTGHGKSDKKQIAFMVPKLLKIKEEIKSDDELDAVAIGLTHFAIHK